MKLRIPICVVLAAIVALAEWKPTPLTGAWRASEIQTTGPNARTNGSPQPGLYIFPGHSGTYEISGDSVTLAARGSEEPGKHDAA